MTITTTDVDVLNEWVQKIHFDNRVDLNLQVPTAGESMKIEIDGIPSKVDAKTPSFSLDDLSPLQQRQQQPADPYLSAILSSPASKESSSSSSSSCTASDNCTCYKCQRQRRRGAAINNIKQRQHDTPVQKSATIGPSRSATAMNIVKPSTTTKRSSSLRSKNSISKRKIPTQESYEKHLPRPSYSPEDSIYRVPSIKSGQGRDQQQQRLQQQHDETTEHDYKISWKDDSTGDDLLDSIKTFQDIFAAQPEDKSTGLSDLLETRAHQLKQERSMQHLATRHNENDLSPEHVTKNIHGCYTMTCRKGGPHRALTLYHTMKMNDVSQRMAAYGTAFDHCVRSNSGLSTWIQKSSHRGPPAIMKTYTPRQRKPTKKSILQPLLSNKKNKGADDMWAKITSESVKSNNMTVYNSSPIPNEPSATTPTDLISAAHNLLPHQSPTALHDSLSRANVNTTPYDHIDIPSRPIPHSKSFPEKIETERQKETCSISSMSTDSDRRSVKLFSSLSRKSLRSRSGTSGSNQSGTDTVYKSYTAGSLSRSNSRRASPPPMMNEPQSTRQPITNEQSPSVHQPAEYQKELDDLCAIMPYHDRQILANFLTEAGGDYLKALTLCKKAVVAGNL
ncbi:hypothetical protein K492DRAFT_211713 [Lichtheimia hyalospora FSU 10163]|nr:hypothetical protein K492DRAFT_211713 [Lichtheimia hyalospora FSU 10163]